ncbi:universal stress protein [uncultured Arthrobacter sp.]|uniref:universal stress protein n=1 Tax=uncultured Arthrobacter sp. TaxID=114050 RepID=UPI003217BC05
MVGAHLLDGQPEGIGRPEGARARLRVIADRDGQCGVGRGGRLGDHQQSAHRLPAGHQVSVEVAHGRTIEEAIDDLEWDEGEIMIVGSSRLAEKNKLFIGSTAHKVLLALPVPMVVVPRDYQRVDTSPED